MNAAAYAPILELRERAKAKFCDALEDDWYLFFSDYGKIDARRPVRQLAPRMEVCHDGGRRRERPLLRFEAHG